MPAVKMALSICAQEPTTLDSNSNTCAHTTHTLTHLLPDTHDARLKQTTGLRWNIVVDLWPWATVFIMFLDNSNALEPSCLHMCKCVYVWINVCGDKGTKWTIFYIRGIIKYLSFCIWLTPFTIIVQGSFILKHVWELYYFFL